MSKSAQKLPLVHSELGAFGTDESRLYKRVASALIEELQSGRFAIGDKMPAERDLAVRMQVSRPVVREAMLALEVLGLIEVRLGAGTFVVRLPGESDEPRFNVSPFELLEARLVFEGEAAALAAVHITDEEIAGLEQLVAAIQEQNADQIAEENADMAFHMAIARATRNAAVEKTVEDLWLQRWSSPECNLLLEQARTANVLPVVDEHTAIVEALRSRKPQVARMAMRAHLDAVIKHLLFAVEKKALAEARRSVDSQRQRFGSVARI
ncbi:FadR family transcriptional regulator [Novosphingobium sp. 2580]|uniref:FadR family transcriptional regulator n=2 Tax=Novosphingobium album (ex Hu et al. 2023) TaxID=2930093 RepID=A0ABT0B5A6_9SPHN|nr:FadR family transcriptional regulator [Novosphingobium album (ex Hu et al. 2023)]